MRSKVSTRIEISNIFQEYPRGFKFCGRAGKYEWQTALAKAHFILHHIRLGHLVLFILNIKTEPDRVMAFYFWPGL
jgi:hypothetical protein